MAAMTMLIQEDPFFSLRVRASNHPILTPRCSLLLVFIINPLHALNTNAHTELGDSARPGKEEGKEGEQHGLRDDQGSLRHQPSSRQEAQVRAHCRDWFAVYGSPHANRCVCRYFKDQPLDHPAVTIDHLVHWYFEHELKLKYAEYVQILEVCFPKAL
jgi:hypothetical protein